MRIYLVGFMGAGKSTVGRLLAERLGLPLVDLDRQAAERRGRPVSEILTDEGEASFRELESALLAVTAELADVVVATGGGALNRASNRRFIQRHGVSVWLHPSFDDLLTRLLRTSLAKRPLFGDASQARALYERRLNSYRQADLEVVVAAGERAKQTVARVVKRLEESRCAT
jgi:shikimate kinase